MAVLCSDRTDVTNCCHVATMVRVIVVPRFSLRLSKSGKAEQSRKDYGETSERTPETADPKGIDERQKESLRWGNSTRGLSGESPIEPLKPLS